MSWLLLLQFITNFIAYMVTDNDESATVTKIEDKNYELGIIYKTVKKTEEIKEKANRWFENRLFF